MVSDDSGMTWSPAGDDEPGKDAVRGSGRECDADGCWEVVPGEQVQFCLADGACEVSFRFSESENDRMLDQSACLTKRYDEFNSVLVVPGASEQVVVAMGTEGVVIRTEDGGWHRQAVGYLGPTPIGIVPTWTDQLALLAPLALVGASPLVFLVRLRRRRNMAALGFAMAACGGFALVIAAVTLRFFGVRYDVAGLSIIAASVAVFVASVIVARKTAR